MHSLRRNRQPHWFLPLAAAAVLLSACEVGPEYMRPAVQDAAPYKEDQGWVPATPQAPGDWTNWWSIYNDPVLDSLEKQVDISNQNLKEAEAAYRSAVAQVGIDKGALLPDVTAGAGAKFGNNEGARGGGAATYTLGPSVSWDADIWGRIKRITESGVADAQASAADLASARLSAQALLATDYFQLRAADEEGRLLAQSIEAFKVTLTIAQNQVKAGITTLADVYTAETEIDGAEAQAINSQLERANYEHAIADLTGKQPSELSIVLAPMPTTIPVVPAGIPSVLLQRRPDIASAELKAKASNALVGAAIAAYYPDLTLSGSYTLTGNTLGSLFNTSNAVWSVGPSLAGTIYNGGILDAQAEQARANYDAAVATYRQTVLDAFMDVENDLSGLRILEQLAAADDTTVRDARLSEALIINQYRAGTQVYTAVVTAQTTRLNSEIAALNVLSQRLTTSVDLVKQLGGGWDAAKLPQPGTFYSLPQETENQVPDMLSAATLQASPPQAAPAPQQAPPQQP